MGVPEQLRQAVDDAVRSTLRTVLAARGLLLTDAELVASTAAATASGARLLDGALDHWYPERRHTAGPVDVGFVDGRAAARVQHALAFGAATATLLTPVDHTGSDTGRQEGPVGLACAVLNLGVGLVDSLCDGVPAVGSDLLQALSAADVSGAARDRRPRGWLHDTLGGSVAADPAGAFTVRVVESFFDLVHLAYPGEGDASLRAGVGSLLEEALEAERQSVDRSDRPATGTHLVECSRRTSVWPFRIIELLATGAPPRWAPTAGELLGEAMWLVDDLVDLSQDASTGALNGLLVSALVDPAPGANPPETALEEVLRSGAVARAANRAADALASGLGTAPGAGARQARQLFVSVVQRYAGLRL